ncbi:hypothetical protein ACTMTI_08945 [Nonomuraea sp. H19]|uniref:hypothetical protein n=1 Tax=Nonomuraea sp. H19 TaxID=3452206 RepID=UPI003F894108
MRAVAGRRPPDRARRTGRRNGRDYEILQPFLQLDRTMHTLIDAEVPRAHLDPLIVSELLTDLVHLTEVIRP